MTLKICFSSNVFLTRRYFPRAYSTLRRNGAFFGSQLPSLSKKSVTSLTDDVYNMFVPINHESFPQNVLQKRCSSTTETGDEEKMSSSVKELPDGFMEKLNSFSTPLPFSDNKYDLERHGRGESFHPTAPPAIILFPEDVSSVVDIVNLCSEYHIPIIPFGAGTSVEGHVCAISSRPTVSIDMSKFQTIEFPDDEGSMSQDFHVTVGAGVQRIALNEALRHTGMQFMVDPGADASIGGMVACGASGTMAVKYGTMRENILGLECVLPDGTIATCGTKAIKSSAGYDLTSLMTGSEGTLGIITKVTVKLHPIPDHVSAAICAFDTLHDAAEAVTTMRMCGISFQRCELLDAQSVSTFHQYNSSSASDLEIKPTLFLEFVGPSEGSVHEQIKMAQSICTSDLNGSNFKFTANEEERKALWSARHKLYYAAIALRPGTKDAFITDACVPLSKFADLITATVEDVEKFGLVGPCFGHAGDGNFHCILPLADGDSDEHLLKIQKVNDNLIKRTMEAGGTCTGEHGVGYGKIKYLKKQYGVGAVKMMKMIKKSLDPLNIMNPGKVVLANEID